MELIMYVGGIPVDSILVDVNQIHSKSYINLLKLDLEGKNEDIIDLSNQEPQFFMNTIPSRMNDPETNLIRH
jgi:hypothetical protein